MPSLRFWLALLFLPFAAQAAQAEALICCGADEVFLIDPARPAKKVWSWRASDSPRIPNAFHRQFHSTDDCKPYAGNLLLVTSSSDGVALLERETKRCRFLATSRNAHSACLLPRNHVVVAASYGGDEMQFFDLAGSDGRRVATPVQRIPLKGAHGAVWDQKRNCLWALGGPELVRIDLDLDGARSNLWSVTERHALPSPGGHDLSPFHDRRRYYVTSDTQVLSFDTERRTWKHLEGFGTQLKVKSVDRHPATRQLVYHMGTKETWWSDTIRFPHRENIVLPGERLYKVRWDVPIAPPHADGLVATQLRKLGPTVYQNREGRITEVNANRSEITDAQLKWLADCTALTDLSFEECEVTATGMAHLAALPNLEWLNLYQAQVGDAGLAHIAKLPRLQHLPIGKNGITDRGLAPLAGNKRLRYLGLRGNAVTNEGLKHIATITGLRELNLAETQVTRLDALASLKRLEKIWIGDLTLEAGQWDAFKAAHPRCEIQ